MEPRGWLSKSRPSNELDVATAEHGRGNGLWKHCVEPELEDLGAAAVVGVADSATTWRALICAETSP